MQDERRLAWQLQAARPSTSSPPPSSPRSPATGVTPPSHTTPSSPPPSERQGNFAQRHTSYTPTIISGAKGPQVHLQATALSSSSTSSFSSMSSGPVQHRVYLPPLVSPSSLSPTAPWLGRSAPAQTGSTESSSSMPPSKASPREIKFRYHMSLAPQGTLGDKPASEPKARSTRHVPTPMCDLPRVLSRSESRGRGSRDAPAHTVGQAKRQSGEWDPRVGARCAMPAACAIARWSRQARGRRPSPNLRCRSACSSTGRTRVRRASLRQGGDKREM
jgi:hypothetical protein